MYRLLSHNTGGTLDKKALQCLSVSLNPSYYSPLHPCFYSNRWVLAPRQHIKSLTRLHDFKEVLYKYCISLSPHLLASKSCSCHRQGYFQYQQVLILREWICHWMEFVMQYRLLYNVVYTPPLFWKRPFGTGSRRGCRQLRMYWNMSHGCPKAYLTRLKKH